MNSAAPQQPVVPRVPRDRALSTGQMLAMVVAVGLVLYGAAYLLVRWVLR